MIYESQETISERINGALGRRPVCYNDQTTDGRIVLILEAIGELLKDTKFSNGHNNMRP